MPEPSADLNLRSAQRDALSAVEHALTDERSDRLLVHMATGTGKSTLAVVLSYRLLAHAGVRRVLVLTDRLSAAEQLRRRFAEFHVGTSRPFNEEFRLAAGLSPRDAMANVVVATIQSAINSLGDQAPQGTVHSEPLRGSSDDDSAVQHRRDFDLIIVDEASRSIYGKWRAVLEFFDAPILGFTASTPDKRTNTLFAENLVYSYGVNEAVADAYLVGVDLYEIRSAVERTGTTDDPGDSEWGRGSVTSVLQAFRGALTTDIFPDRELVPKTLVLARDEAHARLIAEVVAAVFEAPPGFVEMVTGSHHDAPHVLERFTRSREPRIAVSVHLLSTNMNLSPVECLLIMRPIASEHYFDQLVGRLSQLPHPDDLRRVTPDAEAKTRVVIVDTVGVTREGQFAGGVSRRVNLLEGRQVSLRDLLETSLLESGEELVLLRGGGVPAAQATVTPTGSLRLEDGRQFRTPSSAAVAVLGHAANGWRKWARARDGMLLDTLRQQLLDRTADLAVGEEDPSADDVAADSNVERHLRLKQLRELAESGRPQQMPVKDLLKLWGAASRDLAITVQAEAELLNHGLVTFPDFRAVHLDDRVEVRLQADQGEPSTAEAPGDQQDARDVEEVGQESGLLVGNLPGALGGLESVKPTATVEAAITKMLLFDYSQLAVLSGPRKLVGAVTWRSIARARNANPGAELAAAIVPATEVAYNSQLDDILGVLQTEEFVFVRVANGDVAGIVTAVDVVGTFERMASPFFLIGQLDQALRALLNGRVDLDAALKLCDPDGSRGLNTYARFTMGDYQQVLANPDCWEQLAWPLDRKILTQRLQQICNMRNNLMHFNGEPLPADALSMLRNFIALLREYTAASG
jgi:superfamily II DNA or RNA helicase/CBS domain-containing protein